MYGELVPIVSDACVQFVMHHQFIVHGHDGLAGLNKCEIKLNRKMLSEIAIHDPAGFTKVVETAKAKVC